MKRVLTLLIALTMAISMLSCGDKSGEGSSLPVKVGNMKISEAELTGDESRMLELASNSSLTSEIFDYNLDSKGKQGKLSYYELNDQGQWSKGNTITTWHCEENAGRIYIGYDCSLTGTMKIAISTSAGITSSENDAREDTSSMSSSASVLKKTADIEYGASIPIMLIVVSDDNQCNGADITAYGDSKKLLKQKDNDRLFAVLVTFSDILID